MWMESELGGILSAFKQSFIQLNQLQMEVWQIYLDSCLDSQCISAGVRTACQGVDFDPQ